MVYVYRQMSRQFIYECLKPLVKYENTGLITLIGNKNENQIIQRILFGIVSIIADEPAKNLLAGYNYLHKYAKCSCDNFNPLVINIGGPLVIFRDDELYNNKAIQLYNIWKENILITMKKLRKLNTKDKKKNN